MNVVQTLFMPFGVTVAFLLYVSEGLVQLCLMFKFIKVTHMQWVVRNSDTSMKNVA